MADAHARGLDADSNDPDAMLQRVRFELYHENIYGALEMAEAAHAAAPNPRDVEQAERIRSWLVHLASREAYIHSMFFSARSRTSRISRRTVALISRWLSSSTSR